MKTATIEDSYVHVVIEWIDDSPNIENYHINPNCPEIRKQMNGWDHANFRLMMRHPERIQEIFSGDFIPERSGPWVEKFTRTEESGVFVDGDGYTHRILECPCCAKK